MADEELKLRDDGTVTCTVAGKRHRLRRPTMGELRALREAQVACEDDVVDAFAPFRQRLADLDAAANEADEADEARAKRKEWRETNAEALAAIEGARVGWVREVFTTLSKVDLPDDDADLEPWMASADLAAMLIEHWRSVPLARGATVAGG